MISSITFSNHVEEEEAWLAWLGKSRQVKSGLATENLATEAWLGKSRQVKSGLVIEAWLGKSRQVKFMLAIENLGIANQFC